MSSIFAPGCPSKVDCSLFLYKYTMNEPEFSAIKPLYDLLESYVDNNDGPGNGKVRGSYSGTGYNFTFYYKLGPIMF